MAKKINTYVSLDKTTWDEIEKIAKKKDASKAYILRRIVQDFLDNQEAK